MGDLTVRLNRPEKPEIIPPPPVSIIYRNPSAEIWVTLVMTLVVSHTYSLGEVVVPQSSAHLGKLVHCGSKRFGNRHKDTTLCEKGLLGD